MPLTISGAHLSKKRFHAGSQVKIQFMLSLAAQVKVTITHLHHGRAVTNGSFSAHEHAGKVSIGFDGTRRGYPARARQLQGQARGHRRQPQVQAGQPQLRDRLATAGGVTSTRASSRRDSMSSLR